MTTAEKLHELTQSLPEPIFRKLLDFAGFLQQRRKSVDDSLKKPEGSLAALPGGLEKSQACDEDPVAIQKRIRDAWA